MAQPGNFTPILLYSSSTPTNVPLAANLTNSTNGAEIAINIADKNLFFKDSGGTVNTVPIRQSSTSSNGWLSSTDWNTFSSKAPATSGTSILYGNGSGGFSNVTIGSGISFVGGTLSATGSGGTVTSVSGTGTVNGLTLTGTVTTSGSLTLGGTLDLSSPPAIGGTTAAAITGTTITANTKFVGTYFDAANSAGGSLRNASGTALIQWGAGGGTNISLNGATNINGANAQVDISPTGTGHVHINPTGSGSVEINPTNAGTINNMVIGGTTPLAITGTTITATTFSGSGASLTSIPNSALTNSTISGVALGGSLFNLTAGTGVSFSAGTTYNGSAAITINATGSGGTVTSVAALTLGTTGTDLSSTVANGTTTPVITLNVPTASATNRGALSAADWTTFNNKQPAGTYVTSVTGTAPVVSSGGTTPAISMAAATASVNGYLTSTDWNTFNNKTSNTGTVTSVAASVPAFLSISGSPITTSGTLAITLSGTALPVANGGTGLTSLTANYIPYGNGTSAFSSSSTLTYNGTSLTAGNFVPGSSTAPTNGIFLPTTNAVGIATNSAEAMRIHSSSGVSIGNATDPGSKNLSVSGSINSVGVTSSAAIWGQDATTFQHGYSAYRGTIGGTDEQILTARSGYQTKIANRLAVLGNIVPYADNTYSCGESSLRWSVIYSATALINTSDERTKEQITTDLAPELKAWAKVEYCKFKFKDAVTKKSDGARWHIGLIAQRVKEAFESEGLDAFAYGILCYDKWDDKYTIHTDEEGNETDRTLAIPAGDMYGIRYEEALALECAYLRSKLNI